MWPLIALVVIGIIVVWILRKKTGKEDLPHVRYVCDLCGEKDCLCHKEETEVH